MVCAMLGPQIITQFLPQTCYVTSCEWWRCKPTILSSPLTTSHVVSCDKSYIIIYDPNIIHNVVLAYGISDVEKARTSMHETRLRFNKISYLSQTPPLPQFFLLIYVM